MRAHHSLLFWASTVTRASPPCCAAPRRLWEARTNQTRMSEAALRAEDAALNARCAANPREAADYAAHLRRTPHAAKERWLWNSPIFNHTALVRLLLADGVSPRTTLPEQGELSVLHMAAQYGSIDVLCLLLKAGADASSSDDYGNTPLTNAVCKGQLACASELILHTDLRIFIASGNNVLHASIIANQPEIFKLLLPHFVDNIDVRTIKPRPPLSLAVRTTARR